MIGKIKTSKASAILLVLLGLFIAAGLRGTFYQDLVIADNPDYYWTFDEGSGNAANHASSGEGASTSNEFVPEPGASYTTSTSTFGGASLGNAIEGDGTSGSVFFASNLTGGSMTSYIIEFWVRADTPTDPEYIIDFRTNDPGVITGFEPGDPVELFGAGSGRTGSGGPTDLLDNQFHHVVIGLLSGAKHAITIDNSTTFTTTSASAVNIVSLQEQAVSLLGIYTGPNSSVNSFDGVIDELAIYDLTGSSGAAFDAKMASIAAHSTEMALVPEPGIYTLAGLCLLAFRQARRAPARPV